MFNNSVKHRSEMVGDQCSRQEGGLGGGGGGGGRGNGIILTARI